MKYSLFTGSLLLLSALAFSQFADAQERVNRVRVSPNASVSQTVGTTQVSITYGRPSVRDREIFGGLVPYGTVWRTGADEAATITFSEDVTIEGEALKAGTYGLFTLPGEEEWEVIFNNVPNQWGAYNYDSSEDELRVKVTPEEGPHMEQFLILFENVTATSARVVLHWHTVKVPFSIELPAAPETP